MRPVEIIEGALLVSIGSFVAFEDAVAEVRASAFDEAARMHDVVRDAVHRELRRDIALDAAYGIEQIETLAWDVDLDGAVQSQPGNPRHPQSSGLAGPVVERKTTTRMMPHRFRSCTATTPWPGS